MRKILLMAGVACLVATGASAFEFNPYVSAKAKYGISRNEIKYTGVNEYKLKYNDNVWGASFAVGTIHHVTTGDFRFELEYTKNSDAEKDNVKVKTQGVLFNAYFDLDLGAEVPLKPYAGIGLGWGRAEFDANRWNIKDDGVSAQIGVGVSYKVCDHTNIDLGYRYITYGDFEKEYRIPGLFYEKVEYKPHSHELLLGVRYEF